MPAESTRPYQQATSNVRRIPVSSVPPPPTYRPQSTTVPIWMGRNAIAPADQVSIGRSSQAALNASPAYQRLTSGGTQQSGAGINNAALRANAVGIAAGNYAMRGANPAARAPAQTGWAPGSSGGSGGRGGGGGGGGGGAGAGGLSQEMLDWLAAMLGRGQPVAQQATAVDLPDFAGKFDPSVWNTQRQSLGSAVGTDTATAQQATKNLMNFLTSNYQNAYTNPRNTYATAGQAPGMDQMAMQRMLQAQGVDPSVMAAEAAARAGADQAFGNFWQAGAANEDTAQRNRLGSAAMSGTDALNRINALGLAGTSGLNIGEAGARTAFDQQVQERNWQTAQQEALENWQRQNQVSDVNNQNTVAYRNQVLQTLIGLMPQLAAGVTMPDLATLGIA